MIFRKSRPIATDIEFHSKMIHLRVEKEELTARVHELEKALRTLADNKTDGPSAVDTPPSGESVDQSALGHQPVPVVASSEATRASAPEPSFFDLAQREQTADLVAKISLLEETNSKLRAQADELKERLNVARERLTTAQERTQLVRDRLHQNRTEAENTRRALNEKLETTRGKLRSTSALWKGASKYSALIQQGTLFDMIDASGIDFSADAYLPLLPSSIPAAMMLQQQYGGRVVCDCVENVEVERHSLAPNLHPPAREMVNLAAYGGLSRCDGLMTVSNAVAKTLSRYGRPVRVQPNYRRFEVPTESHALRGLIGVGDDAIVLATSGGVVQGFESVLEALAQLPANIHLAAFVRIRPFSYEAAVLDRISALGLEDRVHILGFVPYEELASLLADADLGIMILDPDNPNHSVSLPNRVFDFTTSGLPFVAPPIPEIADYVNRHTCGLILSDVSSASWAEAITHALADLPRYKVAMEHARTQVTWETLEEGLIEFLGFPKMVTLLGFRDLSRYQRFLRIADTLTSKGIGVKAAFFSEDPLPLRNPQVEFYHYSDRYGREPGLRRVPTAAL